MNHELLLRLVVNTKRRPSPEISSEPTSENANGPCGIGRTAPFRWICPDRPREAPDVWCPENRPKSPSNSQISGPQIVKFGQRMPRDVLKWQFFPLTQKCLITLLKLGNKRQQAVIAFYCSLMDHIMINFSIAPRFTNSS
jgi:hypothetical protein